jgi:lysophospholipase L1-like esterase
MSPWVQAGDPPDVPAFKKNKDGTPDQRFMKRHEGFVAEAKKGGIELLLVGDFLTDDWRGNNKNHVAAIYEKTFGGYHPANFGQGGDYTQHVLWRLQNGELEGIEPKVVMLLIGGINGSNGDDPQKIAAGVQAIIVTVQQKVPGAKVLLVGVPPWQEKSGKLRARQTAVNSLLAAIDDGGKTIKYVDLGPRLIGPDGTVPKELMPDGVHLSEQGYQVWADAVAAPLKELMGGLATAVAPATAPAPTSTPATAPAAVRAVDYGTILSVDAGVIRFVPWGEKADAAKIIPAATDASILVNLDVGKVADLKAGMWLKVLERDGDRKVKRLIAGQFLQEDGDKVVVFKGLPEEFLVHRSEGWYTNTAGGVRFKVQPMGAGKTPSNPGTNLRAAEYKEPAGGFVVYFPKTLQGAVLGWGGFKLGANEPDADGKVLVNKDTCTDYYWKHLKNPARPEAGYVSGMTEFTIRKLPPRP